MIGGKYGVHLRFHVNSFAFELLNEEPEDNFLFLLPGGYGPEPPGHQEVPKD